MQIKWQRNVIQFHVFHLLTLHLSLFSISCVFVNYFLPYTVNVFEILWFFSLLLLLIMSWSSASADGQRWLLLWWWAPSDSLNNNWVPEYIIYEYRRAIHVTSRFIVYEWCWGPRLCCVTRSYFISEHSCCGSNLDMGFGVVSCQKKM